MTAQILPENPRFAFCPAYDVTGEPQQIRLVFDGMSGYVPTALVALTLADAERLCDQLNAQLGLNHETWTALVSRSMRSSTDGALPN